MARMEEAMTRDEAIKILRDKPIGKDWESDWVDKLAALGVLKLDDPPKTLWQIVRDLGVDITTSQRICNAAWVNGIIRSPHGTHDQEQGR